MEIIDDPDRVYKPPVATKHVQVPDTIIETSEIPENLRTFKRVSFNLSSKYSIFLDLVLKSYSRRSIN